MQHQIGNGSISYWMCKSLLENKFNSVTKTTLLPFQFPFQNIFSTLLQVDIPWIMCHLVWNKIAGSALTIYFTQFYILLIYACIKEKFFLTIELRIISTASFCYQLRPLSLEEELHWYHRFDFKHLYCLCKQS